jgi:hypothetical protein
MKTPWAWLAYMPVSTMDAVVGDQLFIRTKIEIAGFFQTDDVQLGELLGMVASFVAKSPRWLGAREEGLFQ